ncbi:DNA excision repair protein ERCC-8 [Parasteatoda tepidariorum]|uniref:DNA excision repair protein ERCC-8 n=1 Tax=Parasteatoda tepidariorum TaxID=114398 RepID=UPI00077FE09F|nr:DNA excision repair protein ERCC-8 [Parasteatoda tepidariorum]XP_015928499.1 DNA excision repair protein ERCC-8 [Parasteatoda tepidariorum]
MLKSLEQLQYGMISPKSFQAASAMNRIFDIELSTSSRIERFHKAGVNCLDIDKIDERYLLSGGSKGSLCIHDLQNSTGKSSYKAKVVCQKMSAHKFSITTVQWFPFDTGIFVTSGMDNKLKIWDTNSMRPADIISFDFKASCHDMSPVSTQHSLIAVALGYPHVVLIDPKTGSRCHELRAHKNAVTCTRWSPTCEYLLASGGIDNKIFLWDIRSAKGYLQTLDQHNGLQHGSKKDLKTAHNGAITCLKFTNDGLYLVSYGTDSRIRLWDVAMCRNTLVNFGKLFDNTLMQSRSMDLCNDSNPPILFVPNSKSIHVYDLFSGCRIKTLIGHFRTVTSCAFRSATHELLSSGQDMNILLWTPDTAREEEETLSLKNSQNDAEGSQIVDSDNWSSGED